MLEYLRDARQSSREIARKVGVSTGTVLARTRRMEEEGVIRRYTIDVDLRQMGFEVHAVIGVDTEPEEYIPTLEKLRRMEEVSSLYSASGDHMILIECWFRTSTELTEFIKKLNTT